MNVVVLGSWRSGTSLTTMVIAALGLDPGRLEERKLADERNPRGFFELDQLMAYSRDSAPTVLDPLMGRSGFKDPQWRTAPGVPALLAQGREIWQRLKTSESMVVKLPDGGGVPLEFWQEVFDDSCVFVVPFRNPLGVAASRARFRQRGDDSRAETARQLFLWARYHQTLLPQLEHQPVFFLEYGHLLAEPRQVISELAATCRHWGVTVDAANIEAACTLVDPTLHRSPITPLPWWYPRPRFKRLYEALRKVQGEHDCFSLEGKPRDGFDFLSRLTMKGFALGRRIRRRRSST